MNSWYEKCMPRVKDIEPILSKALYGFKKTDGVKSVYVFGSYAKNINNPNFRVRDIDILAKTKFNSGDFLSISSDIINSNHPDSYLEDQGYDPMVVKFSKEFLNLSKNIDCWAISSDKKLLHWGPISVNINDSDAVNKEAEDYANKNVGISRNKIDKSSEQNRKNWFNQYVTYVDKYFDGMPTGWYRTEDIKIKDIIDQSIKT